MVLQWRCAAHPDCANEFAAKDDRHSARRRYDARLVMSASGTKRTSSSRLAMSAFGGKADIEIPLMTQSGHGRLRIAAARTDP
jgi:hypothetical protein